MDIRSLFRSFKIKLFFEGVVRSILFAFIMTGTAVFGTSLVYHILIKEMSSKVLLLLSIGVFLVSFCLIFFIKHYPTKKKTASRMDEMGLKERASTMLANRQNESMVATLQRDDAVLHIKKSKARNMKFKFLKREVVMSFVTVCLALVMILLPHDIFLFAEEEIGPDEVQQQIIKDLIEDLREEIKNSPLDEETKDKANEIVDRLEEELNKTDSKLEMAGKIEEAKKELSELLDKLLTKNNIGKALMKYPLTRPLGEGILNTDMEKVSSALDELEGKLNNDKALVKELSDTVKKALEESGVEATDKLYRILDDFAQELAGIDIEDSDFENKLKDIFDRLQEALKAELERQEEIEEEKEKLEDKLEDAKDEILGEKKEEDAEAEKTGEGEGEGEKEGGGNDKGEGEGDGDKPGNKPGEDGKPGGDKPGNQGGNNQGEEPPQGGSHGGGEVQDGKTEIIYDPISGSVSYGEVFAAYYAEYLEALKKGNVPEELQDIIDNYFSSLS